MAKLTRIDGRLLRAMVICGTNNLIKNKERVNSLNVFPVPDGDTGTNMVMTAISAANEVYKLDTDDIHAVAKAAASGALRGGRGNSGVIFSQYFRGFARGLEGMTTAGVKELASAFVQASNTAYKAVMRPQEGTILTVGRHMAEVFQKSASGADDWQALISHVVNEGYAMLKRTPDMLPVLKQAGVVDSGGDGLMCFLVGAMEGVTTPNPQVDADTAPAQNQAAADFAAITAIAPEDITFGYCTELLIHVNNFSESQETELKAFLESVGDSVATVADDEIVKVHVHTDNPGLVLEYAIKIGPVEDFKLDNMRLQHAAIGEEEAPQERKNLAVVAITSGAGFKEIFVDLGADYVIEGGQTMNPSAEDIAQGIKKVNADNVIVLPNNKNIILAAEQAVYLCEEVGVAVVPSKTLPQGISALMNYLPNEAFEGNVEGMTEGLDAVTTGQVTVAVRDTDLDGHNIKEGHYIGIKNGKIVCTNEALMETITNLASIMMESGYDIFTIFPGADATPDQTAEVEDHMAKIYPDCETTTAYGGQAVYTYIFSAE